MSEAALLVDFVGPPKPYWLYLLECSGGSFYAGIAIDVSKRFAKHCSGKGAKYTRANSPVRVICCKPYVSKGDALRAEIALKRLPKGKKQSFFEQL